MKRAIIIVIASLVLTACQNKQNQMSKEMKTENTELKTATGLPALHQAIIDNNEQRVRDLIKNGADVNELDKRMGNSPLHIASQTDNPKMIEILLENGAFVNLHTPRSGHTPLIVASWYSKPENVKALLKAKDINIYAKSPHGGSTARDFIGGWNKTPTENDKKIIEELHTIFDTYEENLQEKINGQKIYQVVINPKLSVKEKEAQVKELIAQGEPVNTESYIIGSGDDKHSALLVAARNNYPNIVKMLLDAGADIGQRGYTMNAIAFHKGGYMGNPEVLKLLVEHRDSDKYINDQGLNNGYTPLHDAIWHGHTEAAKILIDAGARLDLKNYENDTPLDLAKRYKYKDIVELLNEN